MSIKLKGTTAGSAVILAAPADTSPTGTEKTFTLPAQDGDAGQILKTDGSGALSFTDNLASGRNLVINGAMQVAQRGTTASNTNNYCSLDSYRVDANQGAWEFSQENLSSGAPYNLGFRHFARLKNTTVTTAASSRRKFQQYIEAQNVAQSGWNYVSTTSFITVSFWVRSSVAGIYYFYLQTPNNSPDKSFTFAQTLVADTWTKVEKTIPGASSLVINNDNSTGLRISFNADHGTDFTGSVTLNQWETFNNNARTPDTTTGWSNTLNATFDVTGVQLEVGEKATPFEHKTYDEVHAACDRYLQVFTFASTYQHIVQGIISSGNEIQSEFQLRKMMRTFPSLTLSSVSHFRLNDYRGNDQDANGFQGVYEGHLGMMKFNLRKSTSNFDTGRAGYINVSTSAGGNCKLTFSAEL